MDNDLVITSLNVTSADFTSAIQPQFLKNLKGFLLAGFLATYTSKSPGEDTVLHVKIVYQEVGGMQLPVETQLVRLLRRQSLCGRGHFLRLADHADVRLRMP
jgi:hypothetical protein